MADRDYYNVLGVPRDADADQIKRSYRRLAMRWHPDRNTGDPIAEVRFKQVNEAYRVLSDPLERSRYDRMGPLFEPDGQPLDADRLRATVRRAWDDLVGRKRSGEDVQYTIRITLEQAATGVQREVLIPRNVHCPDCKGLGAPPEQRHVCEVCEGTGKAKNLLRSRCFHCGGKGYVIDVPCGTCQGAGVVEREEAIRIKVPAGVDTGTRLRVAGRGHEPTGDGPAGDLFVVVDVGTHELFTRQGADVAVTLPLSLAEAVLGADVPIPTLGGSTWIRIPAGTPHGHVLRLRGRGMPRPGKDHPGDLLVHVDIEIPNALSEDARQSLARWADALTAEQQPRREAFRKAVESR